MSDLKYRFDSWVTLWKLSWTLFHGSTWGVYRPVSVCHAEFRDTASFDPSLHTKTTGVFVFVEFYGFP